MSDFNLNTFLHEYEGYNKKQYTAAEVGKAAMEERDIQQAEEAVKEQSFLSLTLSEKLTELGVGKRVVQQLGDTAIGAIKKAVVDPLTDYLDKYELVFDQNVYNEEMQAMGKQYFFTQQSLNKEAMNSPVATKFIYDM